jgi:hypothetical protein
LKYESLITATINEAKIIEATKWTCNHVKVMTVAYIGKEFIGSILGVRYFDAGTGQRTS